MRTTRGRDLRWANIDQAASRSLLSKATMKYLYIVLKPLVNLSSFPDSYRPSIWSLNNLGWMWHSMTFEKKKATAFTVICWGRSERPSKRHPWFCSLFPMSEKIGQGLRDIELTADKSGRMDENTTFYSRHPREFLISEAAPSFR